MSTDLVPADNMAALDQMDPATREVAVTQMLDEARSWLAHAVEAIGPQAIVNFKAQMATLAEATKQLGLSKAIQLDAEEMVRRGERGVGKVIRKGQETGEIETSQEARVRATLTREVNQGRTDHSALTTLIKPKSGDYVSHDELYSNQAGIYRLTDGVTDEQFEAAIIEAKSEGNLSRANVVRKVKGEKQEPSGRPEITPPSGIDRTRKGTAARRERIRDLAGRGYSSRQIAKDVGVDEGRVRQVARVEGIDIAADRAMGKTRRIDSNRIAAETVAALEGLATAVNLIEYADLDRVEAPHWDASLKDSLHTINRFAKRIKETPQ